MFVKRITVEEGFLHGLDLNLGEGLTVIIGARGSGKTSIIELIKFCLGTPDYVTEHAERSNRIASAVLGSGRVTVTLDVDGKEVRFTRSAIESEPRRSGEESFPDPVILSQDEIEQIGLHRESRLRLLDEFVLNLGANERSEEAVCALISSLTVELEKLVERTHSTEDSLKRLDAVAAELALAKAEASEVNSVLAESNVERLRLEEISSAAAFGDVRRQEFLQAGEFVSRTVESAAQIRGPLQLDVWPEAAGPDDRLSDIRQELARASEHFSSGISILESLARQTEQMIAQEDAGQILLEDEARVLRTKLDQLMEGAGTLAKKVSSLEKRDRRSSVMKEQLSDLQKKIREVRSRRDTELDRLESIRGERVSLRELEAQRLNEKLAPKVKIDVNRFGSSEGYADALIESLRGGRIKFNQLAPSLAQSMSPRELVLAVEENDAESIATLSHITLDRATRIVNQLSGQSLSEILTARLDDTVELSLLDGGRYKPSNDLSVGQRCTVVLPIIMSHTERVLIVDQPEDNLDNSFIVETLVKVLRERPSNSQIIFATHNANIPVLGEANQVIHMESDGRRGEVALNSDLANPKIVSAISKIMEGGPEAFDTRARFYGTPSTES